MNLKNFDLFEWISSFGISKQLVGDLSILAIFIIAGIILVALIKKKYLGAFLLSMYISYVIFTFSYFLPDDSPFVNIFYFVIIFTVIFIMMRKFIIFNIGGGTLAIWVQSLLLALSVICMFINLFIGVLPSGYIEEFFTPFSKQIFGSQAFQLAWVIIPFVVLAFVKKYRH